MEMLNLQIQIFLLLFLGWFLGRKKMLGKETQKQLSNLVMNVVLPAAIIRSFQLKMTNEILVATFAVLILSIAIQFGCILLNKFVWKGIREEGVRTNLEYGTVVNNAGSMGMVIAEAAFGEEGLLFASVFMIPVRIMMWSYGITLYSDTSSRGEAFKKAALHPCVVAVYIGIVLLLGENYGGFVMPTAIQSTLNAVANCNTALVMIVIGTILSEVEVKHMFDKLSLTYSVFRLLAMPALLLLILKLLPVPALSANVCILESAMPAASTMVMLAARYHKAPKFASKMVFVSTLLSLFTLPLWTWIFTIIA